MCLVSKEQQQQQQRIECLMQSLKVSVLATCFDFNVFVYRLPVECILIPKEWPKQCRLRERETDNERKWRTKSGRSVLRAQFNLRNGYVVCRWQKNKCHGETKLTRNSLKLSIFHRVTFHRCRNGLFFFFDLILWNKKWWEVRVLLFFFFIAVAIAASGVLCYSFWNNTTKTNFALVSIEWESECSERKNQTSKENKKNKMKRTTNFVFYLLAIKS